MSGNADGYTNRPECFVVEDLASIIIVAYNHLNHLKACIGSVQAQEYPHEIILVDNGSSDGTPDFVAAAWPGIRLIRSTNTGFGAGSNLGARHANGEYLVFLNPDTVVEKDWLIHLLAPVRSDPRTITTPKILLYDGSAINTCGNINHFTGLTFTRGLNQPPESYGRQEEVSGISGACFALRKEEFGRMGGFDERFFLYNEDSEFSWRAHVFGLPVVYVPSSVVRHHYSLKVSPEKLYHLERGRYLILKTYLSGYQIVVLSPSLILAEILIFAYASRLGMAGIVSKVKAFSEGLILTKGSQQQTGERALKHFEVRIPSDQLVSGRAEKVCIGLCNRLFSLNYEILYRQ